MCLSIFWSGGMGDVDVAEGNNQSRQVGNCMNSQNISIKPGVCCRKCSSGFQEVLQAPSIQRDAVCMHCPSILEENHSVSVEHQNISKFIKNNTITFPFLGLLVFELSCSIGWCGPHVSNEWLGSHARFFEWDGDWEPALAFWVTFWSFFPTFFPLESFFTV